MYNEQATREMLRADPNKILYHYTPIRHLRAIWKHGLTVGDVPTDLERWKGRIGVWFTSSLEADGHGLEGSISDKKRYRFTVVVPEDASLAKWTDWAPKNVTPKTLSRLHQTASGYETWWVYFGVLPPETIASCVDTITGLEVPNWGESCPPEYDDKAVPPLASARAD